MRFDIHGPFELDRSRNGLIAASANDRRDFWGWVDEHVPGLSGACGCYVFAIQASRGTLPWYVGKAERQSFSRECLTSHKINHFNNAIAGRRGKPILVFLPQLTKKGNFRKPTTTTRRAISELESFLIGMAISRNPKILNTKGTRMLRELTVEGFLNSDRGKSGISARTLRGILGG
jgi:hypothetical protein